MISHFSLRIILIQVDEDEDMEDFIIKPEDNLLLIGKAQDENSSVEVHGMRLCGRLMYLV